MDSILVTGGAGYIGSHTVKVLIDKGYNVVVLDNLTTGHKKAVLAEAFYQGDISDEILVEYIIKKHNIQSVIHFAAKSIVTESIENPDIYFKENYIKTNKLIEILMKNDVKKIVFSSTAAVYGNPEKIPISEKDEKKPINPYGESKLMIEKTLTWLEEAYGFKWCALRYFNAVGADLESKIGEDHKPETHLIPLVIQAAMKQRDSIKVFGTDYETKDGTCIRDYIHVIDLAEAHVAALEGLSSGLKSGPYNVGTGKGYSVKEIIDEVKKVTQKELKVEEEQRRLGDPSELIADVTKTKQSLNWEPKHSDLKTIIDTAWKWHKNNPNGY